MPRLRLSLLACLGLVSLSVLGGCKAKEAPDSGFLTSPHLMSKNENVPFHRIYWDSRYDLKQYTEVYVAPVNVDYVMAQNIWEKANAANISREQINKDIRALAEYSRQSFINALKNDPRKRFKVVDAESPRAIIVETALVQIVPSKPVLQALGFAHWAPNAVAAVGSTVTESEDKGKGVVAIEGRFRDGRTGQVIGMFADRESPKVALLDLKALDWWAPAKDIINTWAKQLVELGNKGPGKKVEDSSTFDFLVF